MLQERDLNKFPFCINCKHWLVDMLNLIEEVGEPAEEIWLPMIGKCQVSGDPKLKNFQTKLALN